MNPIEKRGREKMRITVAGEIKEVKDDLTIAELIKLENVETPQYVSVSVNDVFAKSKDFSVQKLHDGDIVEFLYFMGGGQYGIY